MFFQILKGRKIATEKIIDIIENVQAKPKSSISKKTCALLISNLRIICIPLTSSTLTSSMLGGLIGGSGAAFAYSSVNKEIAKDKLNKMNNKQIKDILNHNDVSFVNFEDINPKKSYFKTGFLSTLGLWAPLLIKTFDKKRYYYDIPIKEKETLKIILKGLTNNIKIK